MSNQNIAGNFLPDLDPSTWATDERFFDDLVFPRQPKQKTENGRARLAKSYANALLRSASPEAIRLGHTLYKCGPGGRCLSGACTCCGTARERGFGLQIAKMFPLSNMALLTLIPSAKEFQHQDLANLDIDHHRDGFSNALAEVRLSDLVIAAGMDVTHNTYTGKFNTDFFAPHWHCIISADHMDEVASRLRRVYHNSDLVKSAVVVKPVTKTPVWAMRYCYKTDFFNRTQNINPDGSRERAIDARITPRCPHFEPLMLALDRIGLDRRVLIQR